MKSSLIAGLIIPYLLIFSLISHAQQNSIDMIIVVDTSGSMSYPIPKQNITRLDHLKESFQCFLNELNYGDKVALFSFDTDTKFQGDFIINSRRDRQKLYETILNLKAVGQFTYMAGMLDKVLIKAKQLRQPVIYIISDGQDDPPKNSPTLKEKYKDFEDKIKQPEGKDWRIIYFHIQGSKQEKSAQDIHLAKLLQENFNSKSITINPEEADASTSLIEMQKKQRLEIEKSRLVKPKEVIKIEDTLLKQVTDHMFDLLWAYILGITIIAMLFFLVTLIRNSIRNKKVMVRGQLELINQDIKYSKKIKIDLKILWKKEITIGKSNECDIPITDLNSENIIKLQAYWKKRRMHRLLDPDHSVKYLKRQHPDRLSYGDSFEISNYKITFNL